MPIILFYRLKSTSLNFVLTYLLRSGSVAFVGDGGDDGGERVGEGELDDDGEDDEDPGDEAAGSAGADLDGVEVLHLGVAELGVPESEADGPAAEEEDGGDDVEAEDDLSGPVSGDLAGANASANDASDGGEEEGDDGDDEEGTIGHAGVLASAAGVGPTGAVVVDAASERGVVGVARAEERSADRRKGEGEGGDGEVDGKGVFHLV